MAFEPNFLSKTENYSGLAAQQSGTYVEPTLLEQLQQQKLRLENQLAKTNEALEALAKHPEVLEVMQKLAAASR